MSERGWQRLVGWTAVGFAAGIGLAVLAPSVLDRGGTPDALERSTEGRVRDRKTGVAADDVERLSAIGYAESFRDPEIENSSVILQDPRAFPGVNLYASRGRAYLMDNAGTVLHEWHPPGGKDVTHVHLLPDGGLLAGTKAEGVVRLDRDSNTVWEYSAFFHHDFWVTEEGEIFVLVVEMARRPELHAEVPVREDKIKILSPDGEERAEISLVDVFLGSRYAFLLRDLRDLPTREEKRKRRDKGEVQSDGVKGRGKPARAEKRGSEARPQDDNLPKLVQKRKRDYAEALEVLHANHVEVFDGRLAGVSELFAEGNLLVSARALDSIFIIDGESRDILWLWGPNNLEGQHHPSLLDTGNILVFDNGRTASEVVEIAPLSLQVRWRYAAGSRFFSATRGGAQRLPNGNTLITESDTGYAFEVTPGKDVVWEFANPDVEGQERFAIWRMERLDPRQVEWLQPGAPGALQ